MEEKIEQMNGPELWRFAVRCFERFADPEVWEEFATCSAGLTALALVNQRPGEACEREMKRVFKRVEALRAERRIRERGFGVIPGGRPGAGAA